MRHHLALVSTLLILVGSLASSHAATAPGTGIYRMTGTLTPEQVTQTLNIYYGSVMTSGSWGSFGTSIFNGGYYSGAQLTSLVLSSGLMTPAFNSSVTSYTVLVPSTASSITVTPTSSITGYLALGSPTGGTTIIASSRILVNGTAVVFGAESGPIPLSFGNNTITIQVQRQFGLTSDSYVTDKTYTLVVNRPVIDTPEIGVREYGSGTNLYSGVTKDLGRNLWLGNTTGSAFEILNTGYGDLKDVTVSMTGKDAAEFRVSAPPASLVKGPTGKTTFQVIFTPRSSGRKSAMIQIISNDADENPFTINLTAIAGKQAEITVPFDGEHLGARTTYFSWDSGAGGSPAMYELWFGSAPGLHDRGSGVFASTSNTTTVTSPGDGVPVYVTLWTLMDYVWLKSGNYTFTDYQPVPSQLVSPANGSVISGRSMIFAWNYGIGVTRRDLHVGTTPGGRDIYAGSQITAMNCWVNTPAIGGKIYVTLWSLTESGWLSNTYVFTTVTQPLVSFASYGFASGPVSGSTLYDANIYFGWYNSGAGYNGLSMDVGSTVGGNDLAKSLNESAMYALGRSIPVPEDGGPVYMTLRYLINGGWQSENYWFNTPLPASGPIPARLALPGNTSTLSSTSETFTWDAGTSVTRRDLWVGSSPDGCDLYKGANETALTRKISLPGDGRRVYVTLHSLISGAWHSNAYYFTAFTAPPPQAAQLSSPADGSALASAALPLTWNAVTGATRYDVYVGSTPMASDLFKGNVGTSTAKTVTVPTDGRPVYVTLWSLIGGKWLQNTYSFTTANTVVGNQKARMATPTTNGSVLPSSSATFDWDAGSGVTNYSLYVGTTPNGRELFSATDATIRSRTLTTLPADGRKIYVTLWSLIGGVWKSNSYLHTAASVATVKAEMTSPAPGSTFTSATVTFNWSAGTGSQYWLQVGRTPGSSNLYAGNQGTNLSKTLTTMPTDGSPIYVKLQSLIGGVWQSNEYIYTAALPP